MSLEVTGVWEAGVWSPTVWADGVWFERPSGGIATGFKFLEINVEARNEPIEVSVIDEPIVIDLKVR